MAGTGRGAAVSWVVTPGIHATPPVTAVATAAARSDPIPSVAPTAAGAFNRASERGAIVPTPPITTTAAPMPAMAASVLALSVMPAASAEGEASTVTAPPVIEQAITPGSIRISYSRASGVTRPTIQVARAPSRNSPLVSLGTARQHRLHFRACPGPESSAACEMSTTG